MKIFTRIIGNIHSPEWAERTKVVEWIALDRWTAQKSRFTARGSGGTEYGIALARHTHLSDGDILHADGGRVVALRIELGEVMVADLSSLVGVDDEKIIRTALELGHAIGNQHWAAVVKGTKVYVPLTVDRKVMASVMQTHHIEGVLIDFVQGDEVIPYLAPHEIRRLFGGAEHNEHGHGHICTHAHGK